jgi:hypothetical protein
MNCSPLERVTRQEGTPNEGVNRFSIIGLHSLMYLDILDTLSY